MADQNDISSIAPAKALALLGYGESVAAYRYRTLADRVPPGRYRDILEEMADEEQGHHQLVQSWIATHFGAANYLLTDEDKALVSAGIRQLDLARPDFLERAIEVIAASERLTGKFYSSLSEAPPAPELRDVLREMAEECFDHATRLEALFGGIDAADPSGEAGGS